VYQLLLTNGERVRLVGGDSSEVHESRKVPTEPEKVGEESRKSKGRTVMDLLLSFVVSFAGSAVVLIVFYSLFVYSSRYASRKRAYARLYWLPAWQCFRFVIRNMESKDSLIGTNYRAWLRSIRPSREGSTVKTFVDVALESGERILLPGVQDLPVICFRFEDGENGLKLVHTNKLGEPIHQYDLTSEVDSLKIEYTVKIRGWSLFKIFKHEIVRTFEVSHYLEAKGKKMNAFRYLLNKQEQKEQRIPIVFLTSEDITITTG